MLSKNTDPVPWSVPSSKTIEMLLTIDPGAIGGKAVVGSYLFLVHVFPFASGEPGAATDELGGGELHPIKCNTLSDVVTLNLGAPAPQWPSSRTSQPISVNVIPDTPEMVAPAEEQSAVNPSFCRKRAWSDPPASGNPWCVCQAAVTILVPAGAGAHWAAVPTNSNGFAINPEGAAKALLAKRAAANVKADTPTVAFLIKKFNFFSPPLFINSKNQV